MFWLPRSISKTLVPVVGLVALVNVGCATSIAATYPHLDRRSVCRLVPGIEADATEFIFADGNIPISNFHPEVVDRVALTARTVFERDPNADPDSVRYLPAPYNELTCPERFSVLPSGEPQASPLPEASFALVLHEQRPEVVPRAVTEKLANCVRQSSGQLKPIEHTMTFNVYLTNDGQTKSALMAQSTLGVRKIEACMVAALRTTSWPVAEPATVAVAPQARVFFAQPAPVMPQPDSGPESGIRQIQPRVGVRIPRIFVIPLNPLVTAAAVFGIIYFWSETDAPAWNDELNPITREPYTSLQEYEDVHRLSPQEILQRQREQMTNTPSQPPPAPAPTPQPAPAQQKQLDPKCDKTTEKIDEIINKERDPTPPGGKPQGRKGIKWRWQEIAENKGKWGPKPDGSLGRQMQGHLDAYEATKNELIKELRKWYKDECIQKGYTLPRNAGQYAAQEPEIGPGKPVEPAPTPIWTPQAANPTVIVPQTKKASK